LEFIPSILFFSFSLQVLAVLSNCGAEIRRGFVRSRGFTNRTLTWSLVLEFQSGMLRVIRGYSLAVTNTCRATANFP
jgi:hypothetical protein